MKDIEVSIAQGKRDLTKILRDTLTSGENIILTRRGKPAAVIIPFEDYRKLKRMAQFAELAHLRERFAESGLSARDVYAESRKMLEDRS
jgi:prevent-host-death family protein